MKIISIQPNGCTTTLSWAISNKINLLKNSAIADIINAEMNYLITIDGINGFELFRLSQIFRDRFAIVNEKPSSIDPVYIKDHFPGMVYDKESNTNQQLADMAEYISVRIHQLAMQMSVDTDIISNDTVKMMLPMVSKMYTVTIPLPFLSLLRSLSDDEYNLVFNDKYPVSLLNYIESNPSNPITRTIKLRLLGDLSPIKYSSEYDRILSKFKYSPLKLKSNDRVYNWAMISMSKQHKSTSVGINMITLNPELYQADMDIMKHLPEDMDIDIVIQLPIYYMQKFAHEFSDDLIPMGYHSSINDIISTGIIHSNFIIKTMVDNNIKMQENELDKFRLRISEAMQMLQNGMAYILKSSDEINPSDVFALMPFIYTTRAVIRINTSQLDKLHSENTELNDMLAEIVDFCRKFKD